MNVEKKQKLGIGMLHLVRSTLNQHSQSHAPLLLKMFWKADQRSPGHMITNTNQLYLEQPVLLMEA